jgi:hypothetical protein
MIFVDLGADGFPLSAVPITLVQARSLCAPILGKTGAGPHYYRPAAR